MLAIRCADDTCYSFFFFIRTSNFDAEAERSYIFWRFEAETFLKMFLNLPGIVFQPISADHRQLS